MYVNIPFWRSYWVILSTMVARKKKIKYSVEKCKNYANMENLLIKKITRSHEYSPSHLAGKKFFRWRNNQGVSILLCVWWKKAHTWKHNSVETYFRYVKKNHRWDNKKIEFVRRFWNFLLTGMWLGEFSSWWNNIFCFFLWVSMNFSIST